MINELLTNNYFYIIGPDTEKTEKATQTFMKENIPDVEKHFLIEGKIGEGTFSKVYRARLIKNRDKEYALKYVIPTIKPSRVALELRFLRDLGGVDNVCGVDAALTSNGHTVIVLPYFEHDRFLDYMYKLTIDDIRDYMKNLLLALARIHQKGVIHRDIKPSNFLYNHSLKKYLLVDFGLAQEEQELVVWKGKLQQAGIYAASASRSKTLALKDSTKTMLNATANNVNNPSTAIQRHNATKQILGVAESKNIIMKKRSHEEVAMKGHKKMKNGEGIPVAAEVLGVESTVFNTPVTPSNMQTPIKDNKDNKIHFKTPTKPSKSPSKSQNVESPKLQPIRKSNRIASRTPTKSPTTSRLPNAVTTPVKEAALTPASAAQPTVIPETPLKTATAKDNPKKMPGRRLLMDETPKSRLQDSTSLFCDCFQKPQICKVCSKKNEIFAPRAGTPGFRAPEVLLKTVEQTTAIDVWSAGVIFVSLLSGRYPFFRNSDDMTSLSEIISFLGSKRVFRAAKKLGKSLIIDNLDRPACDFKQVCESLRSSVPHAPLTGVPDSAYDLLDRLLDPHPLKRITAEQALKHPFISQSTTLQEIYLNNSFTSNETSSQELESMTQ